METPTTPATAVELPLYQCHKQVRAAKITGISPQNPVTQTCELFLGEIQSVTTVTDEWQRKHKPQVGGYYVQYADGYTSYSPAQAFEEGYTPISSDYRDRVRQEHADLVTKITKLEAYLVPIKPPPAAQPYEVHVLFDQLDVMRRYRDILALRIHNF